MTREEMKKLIDTLRYYSVSRQDCFTAATLLEKHFMGPEYRHKKRGSNYVVVGEARLQFSAPLADGDMLVLYRGEDGVYSVRHPQEFNDGRFVHITGKQKCAC